MSVLFYLYPENESVYFSLWQKKSLFITWPLPQNPLISKIKSWSVRKLLPTRRSKVLHLDKVHNLEETPLDDSDEGQPAHPASM